MRPDAEVSGSKFKWPCMIQAHGQCKSRRFRLRSGLRRSIFSLQLACAGSGREGKSGETRMNLGLNKIKYRHVTHAITWLTAVLGSQKLMGSQVNDVCER